MAEGNLFENAKSMMARLTEQNGNANEKEKDATKHAFNAAYDEASKSQKQELDQLKEQLTEQNLLD